MGVVSGNALLHWRHLALEEFMMVFSYLSIVVFVVSVGGVLLLQTVFCLLVFGWAARRYLMNIQVEKTKAGA